RQQDVAGEKVAKQTEAKGDDPRDLADQLEEPHDDPDRPAAQVEELTGPTTETGVLDAPELDHDDRGEREGKGKVQIGVGRAEEWDGALPLTREDRRVGEPREQLQPVIRQNEEK